MTHQFSPKEIKDFKEIQALLVFFPGGTGYTSLKKDPGWQEILLKTKEMLEKRGYKTKIWEEIRRKNLFLPFFSSTTNTVRKVKQLIELFPKLKIVLTGRCTGASFVEKVLKAFPGNNQILAIEAARLFEERNPLVAPKRTLVIKNPKFDPFQEGDIWGILKPLFSPKVFIGKGGNLGIGKFRINWHFPGHDDYCFWNPKIAKQIEDFLDIHFPPKK